MKLTKAAVKAFEQDQKQYGTKVARHNVLWTVAADIFRGLGVRRIKTN